MCSQFLILLALPPRLCNSCCPALSSPRLPLSILLTRYQAVLAAIIIDAMTKMYEFHRVKFMWLTQKMDFLVYLVALVVTLFAGLQVRIAGGGEACATRDCMRGGWRGRGGLWLVVKPRLLSVRSWHATCGL
jgi:hypothetical protein